MKINIGICGFPSLSPTVRKLKGIALRYAPKSARTADYNPKCVFSADKSRRNKYKLKRNRAGK